MSVKFTDEFLDHLHVHHGLDRNPIGSTCEALVPKRYFRSFDGQVYKHTAKKLGLDGLPRKLPQRVEPPLHPTQEVVRKWDQHAKEAMEYGVYCATRAAAAKEAYKLWERKEWVSVQDKGKKREPESFETTTERNKRRREEAELGEEAERREALALRTRLSNHDSQCRQQVARHQGGGDGRAEGSQRPQGGWRQQGGKWAG